MTGLAAVHGVGALLPEPSSSPLYSGAIAAAAAAKEMVGAVHLEENTLR